MKIDLHIHSNSSDGVLSVFQIIDEAVKNKAQIISITDHDSIKGYSKKLFDYAKEKNITLIPGVEISTKYQGFGVHILGYNIDLNNEKLNNLLENSQKNRIDYLENVANKLRNFGYEINTHKLKELESVTKAHIALDVIKNENNKELLLSIFGKIPNKGLFIETLLNENCPCYVKKESISPKEVSLVIKNAGGLVFIAHPVAYHYEDNVNEETILKLAKEINADGIETGYVYITKNNEVVNESKLWQKFANENNLLTSIGSDFHKEDGLHPTIGLNDYKFENIDVKWLDKN